MYTHTHRYVSYSCKSSPSFSTDGVFYGSIVFYTITKFSRIPLSFNKQTFLAYVCLLGQIV